MTVSGNSEGPDGACLLQQTTATAYDGDGNVTATIDGLGRVKATTYDDVGNDVADYQGQSVYTSQGDPATRLRRARRPGASRT